VGGAGGVVRDRCGEKGGGRDTRVEGEGGEYWGKIEGMRERKMERERGV